MPLVTKQLVTQKSDFVSRDNKEKRVDVNNKTTFFLGYDILPCSPDQLYDEWILHIANASSHGLNSRF